MSIVETITSVTEMEASLQSTGYSPQVSPLHNGDNISCDVCEKLFIPSASYITMCGECKSIMEQNINGYGKSSSVPSVEIQASEVVVTSGK